MADDPVVIDAEVPPRTSSLLWRIVRWIPAATILLVAAGLLTMMLVGGMVKVIAWYALQLCLPALGLMCLLAVLAYAAWRRRLSRAVMITGVLALGALSPTILWVVPVTYPASIASTRPSATVRLPANVPLRVVWGGDRVAVNYHAMTPDQRWAYDLVAEPYFTGSSKLTDYGAYGIPVVAPATAEVAAAHDGEPDMTPGVVSNNLQAPAGNFVALRLATGTYLLIAHLKPGSLRVKKGERVTEGQELGRCGNSGNTSEPHIHLHHQRQDPSVFPIGFAEGLPLYFRDHDGPPMPEGGARMDSGKPVAIGAVVRHVGK